jgi:hypothetical protein
MGKETGRETGTHQLESADGGTSQNRKKNRGSDRYSPTGEQTKGQVRMGKETE